MIRIVGILIFLELVFLGLVAENKSYAEECCPRTTETIDAEWCFKNRESGVANYLDLLECAKLAPIPYISPSGTQEVMSEGFFYLRVVIRKKQIKDHQEFLQILEKARELGALYGGTGDESPEFCELYVANRYEDLERLGKYFSFGCGNPPSSFLRQLYDEGKLNQQQLRAVCIRIRYSAKTIMEKPVDIDDIHQVVLYNYDESIVRQKDEQMAAEYGADWEKEACTPYPDFGIETEVVNCARFRNLNRTKNHPAREGVVTPYTNYDPPDPPTSEQNKDAEDIDEFIAEQLQKMNPGRVSTQRHQEAQPSPSVTPPPDTPSDDSHLILLILGVLLAVFAGVVFIGYKMRKKD